MPRSANGGRPSPTRAWPARSSTGSPSGPTSSRPEPPRTGSGPAMERGRRDRQRPDQQPDRRSTNRSGVGPVLMITVGPNGLVIPTREIHLRAIDKVRYSDATAETFTPVRASIRLAPPFDADLSPVPPLAAGGASLCATAARPIVPSERRCGGVRQAPYTPTSWPRLRATAMVRLTAYLGGDASVLSLTRPSTRRRRSGNGFCRPRESS